MLTVSITMSAQDNNRPSRQGFDPAKMVEQRTEMMVKKYGLDEKQAAALKALNEKSLPQARMNGNRQRPEKVDTAKAQRPRAERGQRGMGNRQGEAGARQRGMGGRQGGSRGGAQFEEYNKELQKIMTPEQYKAYQEDMQNMRKGGPRGGFNGQRGGARGQRGAQQ